MVTTRFDIQQLHEPVQEAVDDFKTRCLIVVNRTQTPVVACSDVWHTHVQHCMEFLITVSCCNPDINVHMLNNYSFNHTPLSSSFSTTSEISNNLSGSAIFLFAATVFKSPGSSVVLATYTHNHIIYRRWCNTQMSLLPKHNIEHIRLLTTEYTAWTHQPPEYKVLRRALAIISDIIFEAHNVVTAETALRRLPTYSPA